MDAFSPYSSSNIKNFFYQNKVKIQKKWGQNFLTDPNISRLIAKHLDESYHNCLSSVFTSSNANAKLFPKTVLEIGPGFGVLTKEILDKGYTVYAIEIDPILLHYLQVNNISLQKNNLYLLKGDILTVLRLARENKSFLFLNEKSGVSHTLSFTKTNKPQEKHICYIYGNLPYSITTDFFTSLMKIPSILGGLFLIQKEYAQRVLSPKKKYSIGIYLQNSGIWKQHKIIGPSAFFPMPKIDSILIEYRAHVKGRHCSNTILEKLLRLSFGSRRKALRSIWKKQLMSFFPLIDYKQMLLLATECHIDTAARAEDLTPENFYSLCKKIETKINRNN